MRIASIDVWYDALTDRSCHVVVSDDDCLLEIHSLGQRVLTLTCSSVPDALEQANRWRPSRPEAHAKAS